MAYLGAFLVQDFRQTCSKEMYCFTCSSSFCNRCCSSHAVGHNHGQNPCHLAPVQKMHHTMCICSVSSNGMGYNWKLIQRLKDGGRKFIPLRRLWVIPQGQAPAAGMQCNTCHDRTYQKCWYCSVPCKLATVVTGGGRAAVEALVAQEEELGQQAAFDRFCTSCRHLYASSCCPNHLAAHHAGAGAARVLRVVRQGGLVLTPVADLVDLNQGALGQIQIIEINGVPMVPVCQSEEQLEGDPGSVCLNCFKLIDNNFAYCSLQCGADGHVFGA